MDNKVENYFKKISKKCKISNKKKFDILVVDPPWNQGKTGFRDVRPNQTKILDYPTLSKEDIKKLPIREWSKDISLIWLWDKQQR